MVDEQTQALKTCIQTFYEHTMVIQGHLAVCLDQKIVGTCSNSRTIEANIKMALEEIHLAHELILAMEKKFLES